MTTSFVLLSFFLPVRLFNNRGSCFSGVTVFYYPVTCSTHFTLVCTWSTCVNKNETHGRIHNEWIAAAVESWILHELQLLCAPSRGPIYKRCRAKDIKVQTRPLNQCMCNFSATWFFHFFPFFYLHVLKKNTCRGSLLIIKLPLVRLVSLSVWIAMVYLTINRSLFNDHHAV